MKVWIVNPFDTLPAEGNRPLRYWLMAEAFARAGHEVVYWTADFNHVTKRARELSSGAGRGAVRVELVHEPAYCCNVGPRRLWAHWRWARNWRAAAWREAAVRPPPSLVVVSSPPLWIGAEVRAFASKTGAKVVVDVMDAWPETFERVAPRWTLWPLRRVARANYLGADMITTVADNYAALVKEYGFAGEVRRFYHGIEIGPSAPARAEAAHRGVRLVYAGNLGRTYDLATVVEAVRLIDGATLEVAGRGEQEDALKAAGVACRGYLNEEELAGFLAAGDIGVVPMSPDSCVGVPYKFADYSRAGLAIVSSLGGESDRLLAKYGAGAAYRAHDPRSLAEAVKRLLPRLKEAQRGARAMAGAEFDAAAIYDRYVRECIAAVSR